MKRNSRLIAIFAFLAVTALAVQPASAQFRSGFFGSGIAWPEEVVCGEEFTVEVPARNNSREVWRETEFVKLGPTMGTKEAFRPDGHKFKMPDLTEVQPGQTYTFTLELVAPNEAGSYVTHWSMMKGGKPFGPRLARTIKVACGADAGLGAVTFPKRVACGETFTVDVRMDNIGHTDWSAEDNIKLGPAMGIKEAFRADGRLFRMPRGALVAPGQNHTFSIELTAPDRPGVYETSWSMMKAGEPFGTPVSSKIRVRCDQ